VEAAKREIDMNRVLKLTAAAVFGAGLLGISATAASADVVCNRDGDCWHVRHHHYDYRPEYGVVVHPDNWRWATSDHYRWHEHRGRGYWRSGVWVSF
jgi:hypothetical protein